MFSAASHLVLVDTWGACFVTNRCSTPPRSQVDLKDKWRNLVRLVTEPGKQARSIDLTGKQQCPSLQFSDPAPVGDGWWMQ